MIGSTIASYPRITPAYAGRISQDIRVDVKLRDHPRIRGENQIIPSDWALIEGSPPHTRGESLKVTPERFDEGITPAYAGRIVDFAAVVIAYQDHPRIRGENRKRQMDERL